MSTEIKERPACAEKSMPFPTETECPGCGVVVEIWSDEDETLCVNCGYRIVRDNISACILESGHDSD
jgi:predicted RNA-binding Zn-ribbon protein involved in translation (DUF1610 family)